MKHIVYVGNVPENVDFCGLLPFDIQLTIRPTGPSTIACTVQASDANQSSRIATLLDGQAMLGQTISAIERTRLEIALEEARTPDHALRVIALAAQLGATTRNTRRCLHRLVALFGAASVRQAADLARQSPADQQTSTYEACLAALLWPLHPVVIQALQSGSLRQAEEPHLSPSRSDCQLIIDPVALELARRKEDLRRARRALTDLRVAGIVDGPDFKRAAMQVNEANRAVDAFLERFDMSAIRPQAMGRFRPAPAVYFGEAEDLS